MNAKILQRELRTLAHTIIHKINSPNSSYSISRTLQHSLPSTEGRGWWQLSMGALGSDISSKALFCRLKLKSGKTLHRASKTKNVPCSSVKYSGCYLTNLIKVNQLNCTVACKIGFTLKRTPRTLAPLKIWSPCRSPCQTQSNVGSDARVPLLTIRPAFM
jgi:hypothetical protein